MAGTKAGGAKARDRNLAKDPNFYVKIGAIGGRKTSGYAFAHGKVDPSEAGMIGGRISRRGKSKV